MTRTPSTRPTFVLPALPLPLLVARIAGGALFFAVAFGAPVAALSAAAGVTALFVTANWGLCDILHRRLTAGNGSAAFKRIACSLRGKEVACLFIMCLAPDIPRMRRAEVTE